MVRFVSYNELRDHGIAYTRVHLRRLVRDGEFPAPVQLSPGRIAWRLSDVEHWKEARPPARSVRERHARRVLELGAAD